jgi:hypothetical protein
MYSENNEIALRVEILRDGGVLGMLEPYNAPEIRNVATSELKMSFRGEFFADAAKDIDWIRDRIRPVLVINGTEYPCGVFIATTVGKQQIAGETVLSLEGYSPLYLASRVKIEGEYTIRKGTNYIAAVQELLWKAGIHFFAAEDTDLKMAEDRADWPSGTTVLTVVNQLLSEINYRSAWADLSGVVRLTKYKTVSAGNVQHTYAAGKYSIVSADASAGTDYFDKANVFRAVCSSPDLEEPLAVTVENDDPNSPYSTVSMGIRILREEYVDSVPDEKTLRDRAMIMLEKSMQTIETVEFVTALNPTHGTWDAVALDLGVATGIYEEKEWRIVLDASGEMQHSAERVVYK